MMENRLRLPEPLFQAYQKFDDTVRAHAGELLEKPWMLSVSGGKDSLLLWYVAELWTQQNCPDQPLVILHVAYPFRRASKREVMLLQSYADQYKRRICISRIEDGELPRSNLEAWAREKRLAFYQTMIETEVKNGAIFLGRHGEDGVENVLLRSLRQASWWTWTRTQSPNLPIHSPFESLGRQDVLNAFMHVPLKAFEDYTNTSLNFRRNMLRHYVIPEIEHRMGEPAKGFREMIPLQRALDERYIQEAVKIAENELGVEWIQRVTFPYRRLKALASEDWELCLWIWIARFSGPNGVNTKRFCQLLRTLKSTDEQYPKQFSFAGLGEFEVRKHEISLCNDLRKV